MSALFEGNGEIHFLGRELDWSATPLGAADSWSPALRAAVRICLDAAMPVALWAGPEFVLIHNEGYRRALGSRFPNAFGQPARAVWPETWDDFGADLREVLERGASKRYEEKGPTLDRPQEVSCSHSISSLSPIREEDGRIVAVLEVLVEGARRPSEPQPFLLTLSDALRRLDDPITIQETAARLLGEQLHAQRTLYAEYHADEAVIHRDYVVGVPSMAGRYPIESFGPKEFLPIFRRGEAYVVSDVRADDHLGDLARDSFLSAHIACLGIASAYQARSTSVRMPGSSPSIRRSIVRRAGAICASSIGVTSIERKPPATRTTQPREKVTATRGAPKRCSDDSRSGSSTTSWPVGSHEAKQRPSRHASALPRSGLSMRRASPTRSTAMGPRSTV